MNIEKAAVDSRKFRDDCREVIAKHEAQLARRERMRVWWAFVLYTIILPLFTFIIVPWAIVVTIVWWITR